MFTRDMYVSMARSVETHVDNIKKIHPIIADTKTLKVIGAHNWNEVAIHFADISQLAIWNHFKTWVVCPPNIEGAHFKSKQELLSSLVYINWGWAYTPKFKKLLEQYSLCMMSVGEDLVNGVRPVRDLSHFDL